MKGDDLVAAEEQRAAQEAAGIGGETGAPPQADPAQRPVLEAGGGEAEGFEQAEAALVDHAEHGDLGHSPRHDALAPEAESDRAGAEYGEADRVEVSEADRDRR